MYRFPFSFQLLRIPSFYYHVKTRTIYAAYRYFVQHDKDLGIARLLPSRCGECIFFKDEIVVLGGCVEVCNDVHSCLLLCLSKALLLSTLLAKL